MNLSIWQLPFPPSGKKRSKNSLQLKSNKGIYCLLINTPGGKYQIGSPGEIFLEGNYIYVGSAQGNLKARIERHLSKEKKLHWHVDYLLRRSEVEEVLVKEDAEKRQECETALKLSEKLTPVKGFGSSDCRCVSHLFRIRDNLEIREFLSRQNFVTYYKKHDKTIG